MLSLLRGSLPKPSSVSNNLRALPRCASLAMSTNAIPESRIWGGFSIAERVAGEVNKTDVWSVFSPASGLMPKDSINLGQGFMNWAPPEYVQKAAQEAIVRVDTNHYSLSKGRARLREALSKHYSPSFKRELDPNTEICVTSGANEGIYAFEAAFLNPGEEVIMFEPFFDQYIANTTFNQGVPVYVPLHPPPAASKSVVQSADWKIDWDELRAAITPRTKIIFLNTPHNPIGKVFDEDELRKIGQLAEEFNLIIMSDEVYDCITFGKEHIRIATIDNHAYWNRTITVGSAGKSFSATGWRVGWVVGPRHLVHPTLSATTRIVFTTNSPLQEATAVGFEQAAEEDFFAKQTAAYLERRAVLLEALDKVGLPYTIPDGSYFVLVQNERIKIPDDYVFPDVVKNRPWDWKVSWFLAQTVGVVAIPPSDFYSAQHQSIGEKFTRLAFCKDLDTLRAAGERLLKLKPYLVDP